MAVALLLAADAGAALPARAEQDCGSPPQASLDLGTDVAGGGAVTMNINGRPFKLLVDTGGIFSMLTESAVDSLGLYRQKIPFGTLSMYGGESLKCFVLAEDVKLGTMALAKTRFVVMPDDRLPPGIAGTLAPDVLAGFDTEFDFADARLNLYSPRRCGVADRARKDGAKAPIELDSYSHVIVPVQVDGKEAKALLDTGSSSSLMNLKKAEALFGLKEDSPGMRRSGAADGKHTAFRYPFHALALGVSPSANPISSSFPTRYRRAAIGT
jgi:predicted aspartyl protease